MLPRVQQFLLDNISLIERNDFTSLYKNCFFPIFILTNTFYKAGIEPLEYMEEVPDNFYSDNILSVTIPPNIKRINEFSLPCNLEELTILNPNIELPKITTYQKTGLYNTNLGTIYIPKEANDLKLTLTQLRYNCAYSAYQIKEIEDN